jgi:hypothetical protein
MRTVARNQKSSFRMLGLGDVWNNEVTAIPALDLPELFTGRLLCQALTESPDFRRTLLHT